MLSHGTGQPWRLNNALYPNKVICSVAEKALAIAITNKVESMLQGLVGAQKVMSKTCKLFFKCQTNWKDFKRMNECESGRKETSCSVRHRKKFVKCSEGVVYAIPLTWNRNYIGYTGRWINERLKEHNYTVSLLMHPGHLASRCAGCKCTAMFSYTKVLARSFDKTEEEIIQTFCVHITERCISTPSIALFQKEISFLKGTISLHT